MRLVISHFFDEEFMLPWWLRHHRELFDHGILIDYASTDRSVEICRELVPEWEVLPSRNEHFSALRCDFEVMQHEARFPEAWKIALNTTEFLVGDQLDSVIERAEQQDRLGVRIPGTAMVDDEPEQVPDPGRPLVEQKYHGFWESEFPSHLVNFAWFFPQARTRLLHRHEFGAYKPGRHETFLPHVDVTPNTELGIWWYGYSPWTTEFVARKTQIQTRMDPVDKQAGFGRQHLAAYDEQQARRRALLPFSHDLCLPGAPTDQSESWRTVVDEKNGLAARLGATTRALDEEKQTSASVAAERDSLQAQLDAAIGERDSLKLQLDSVAAASQKQSAKGAAPRSRRGARPLWRRVAGRLRALIVGRTT